MAELNAAVVWNFDLIEVLRPAAAHAAGTVWYVGMVRYGPVWIPLRNGMVWYGMVWNGTV